MSIREFCRETVESVRPTETLRDVARLLDRSGLGCAVVAEGGQVRGVVTDRDVALAVFDQGMDPDATEVQSLLAAEPIVVHEDRPLRVAAALLRRHHLRRLPVVDRQGGLVGIISRDDLIQRLSGELAGLAQALHAQEPCGSAVLRIDDLAGVPA